jgi:hypothetical protein
LDTLALDPGLTTGFAILDDNGAVMGCGNLDVAVLHEGLDQVIRTVNRTGHEMEVVVERIAVGRQGKLQLSLSYVLVTIDHLISLYGLTRHDYTPGTWKTSAIARLDVGYIRPDGKTLTPHERDAIGLGRYRIRKRGKEHVPPPRLEKI